MERRDRATVVLLAALLLPTMLLCVCAGSVSLPFT